jgi:hypothetical protein
LSAVLGYIVPTALALLKEITLLERGQQWKPREKTTEIFSLNASQTEKALALQQLSAPIGS